MSDQHVGFAVIQPKNGTVTIPVQLRRQFGLDRPGAQVEIVVRDGEIVLVPHVAVPTEQAWFWTEGHQAAEQEADEDITESRLSDLPDEDALLTHLSELDEQAGTCG